MKDILENFLILFKNFKYKVIKIVSNKAKVNLIIDKYHHNRFVNYDM